MKTRENLKVMRMLSRVPDPPKDDPPPQPQPKP
jgi:hypothetical protein